MMREFANITGMPGAEIRRVGMQLTRAGYAVIPLRSMASEPLCTLNKTEARAAGDHQCGLHHALTDAKDVNRVFARLAKLLPEGGSLNIGIVAGPSNLIVIDSDLPEHLAAFARDIDDAPPTVKTPGKLRSGEWIHHDGGHHYYAVPDGIELPTSITTYTAEGGYSVRWGNQYTVAPPSVRDEGAYVVTSDITEAPAALLAAIESEGARRSQRLADSAERLAHRGLNITVVDWSVETSWAELLSPDGWTFTGRTDSGCGCDIWEKPGGGTHTDRSAIAHSADCDNDAYANIEGHAPLHWFTDDPPPGLAEYGAAIGSRTITKLDYYTWVRCGGSQSGAMHELGLDDASAIDAWLDAKAAGIVIGDGDGVDTGTHSSPSSPVASPPSGASESGGPQARNDSSEAQLAGEAEGSEEGGSPEVGSQFTHTPQEHVKSPPGYDFPAHLSTEALQRQVSSHASKRMIEAEGDRFYSAAMRSDEVLPSIEWGAPGDIEPAVATFCRMGLPDDGERQALLPDGKVSTVFGRSSAGKSWLAIYCAIDAIEGNLGATLYVDAEDSQEGYFARLDAVGADSADKRYGYLSINQLGEYESKMIATSGADLIVVDSINALVAGAGDGQSSNDDDAIRRLVNVMRSWPATVLFVDHASEKVDDTTSAMGASAKKAAPDGVVLRIDKLSDWRPNHGGTSQLLIGKDRHGVIDVGDAVASDPHGFTPVAALKLAPGSTARLSLWPHLAPTKHTDEEIATFEASEASARITEIISTIATHSGLLSTKELKLLLGGQQLEHELLALRLEGRLEENAKRRWVVA